MRLPGHRREGGGKARSWAVWAVMAAAVMAGAGAAWHGGFPAGYVSAPGIGGSGNEKRQDREPAMAGNEEYTGRIRRKPGEHLRQLLEQEVLVLEAEGRSCRVLPVGDNSMDVLVPAEFVKQVLQVSVLEYPDSRILMEQGNDCVEMDAARSRREEGKLYLPLRAVCDGFGYDARVVPAGTRIFLEDRFPLKKRGLPSSYDYRKRGRSTAVKDQGSYGTCWSFASLTALETALRPGDTREFSADHMSLHNSFSLNQREGGEYTMSMAYLLGWQGPVLEEEDPYGDGVSPEGLEPAVHVQEIRILPSKDYEAIKRAVFLTGGVQSSLYTSITGSHSRSVYYNEETNAYCYRGEQVPNHDIVIVGWDDGYPKENFQTELEGDGAFLCVSSWGEAFGDQGYFYVSYYDSNIGSSNLVYTGIEAADNYDNLYQSDLCGWVGQVGYGTPKAYGANVYEAEARESLNAVGFYATGDDTSYVIGLVRHAENEADFQEREILAQGIVKYSGFYTIPLEVSRELEKGERFALILEAETPGTMQPLAVEYQADDATAEAVITDGEGYISPDGARWEPMESRYQCNLCLKAYTKRLPET